MVVGPVVSTAKHETYTGHKLLCVQPVDPTGKPEGSSFLAVDTVDSGEGVEDELAELLRALGA